MHTIFGGDFNANTDFGNHSSNIYGIAILNSSIELNFKILNPPSPTCYASHYGSYIGKFIFTNSDTISSNIKLVHSFSDHMGISIDLPGSPEHLPAPNFYKLFHLTNINRLNKFIESRLDLLHILIKIYPLKIAKKSLCLLIQFLPKHSMNLFPTKKTLNTKLFFPNQHLHFSAGQNFYKENYTVILALLL